MMTRIALTVGHFLLGLVGMSMADAVREAPVPTATQVAAFDHLC
jgi:hypothetical protein